jgi:hypothetical protein
MVVNCFAEVAWMGVRRNWWSSVVGIVLWSLWMCWSKWARVSRRRLRMLTSVVIGWMSEG